MDRIDKFEQEMESINYYISNPLDFIYERIEDPTSSEIIECYRFIYYSNKIVIERQRDYLKQLEDKINGVRPLVREHTDIEVEENNEEVVRKRENRDFSNLVEYITYCNFDTELDTYLETLSKDDIVRLKIYFLKEIKLYEAIIKDTVLGDYTADISSLQSELSVYKEILEHLKDFSKKEEVLESKEVENSNIIILPSKRSSYLLEDIRTYGERSKEIKTAFDKIVEGYFLKTKDIKAIREAKENLYEYCNPNGLRILFFVKNNYVFIASLFFKDKQKSTRISGYYDDAHNRYYSAFDYIVNNLNNPDFYIEQAELVGQIYTYLEANMVITKRLGDKNE